MFRQSTFAAVLIAGALTLAAAPSIAHPTAQIRIDVSQGGFVIGGTSGHGVVRYHRRNYPVSVGGFRVGATIGIAKASLEGRFSKLTSLSDIEGTYTSLGASASLGGGRNIQQFKNANGVHLELEGFQEGAEFSLDVGTITLRLER